MSFGGKLGWFVGGLAVGLEGIKLLTSKDARKVYTEATAAVLRCKDEVVKDVELVQEGCADILADAKEINEKRKAEGKAVFVEDEAKEEVKPKKKTPKAKEAE